jgi:hypothetical protein
MSGGNPWENHFSKNTTQPWRKGIKSNKTKFYDTYFDICVRRSRYAFPINKYFAPKALFLPLVRAHSFMLMMTVVQKTINLTTTQAKLCLHNVI